ncbi:MAG: hypothetical protein ACO2OS_04960 [Thermosphaera aggregans]|jgi:hypothetical protein|uniref:hypothetical protein n=1 Tax=Thermosphaera aggregans TaxID=54254 RepID=UPI003C05B16D
MVVKELKSLLEKLLETAVRERLSYTDFLRLLATYPCPSELDFTNFHDILAMIKKLSDEVAKASDTLLLMRQRAENLVKKGYKPLLVDCFGLPEIYEVYAKITKKCGTLAVSVEPHINALALTSEFEKTYGSPTMLELAKALGTSLYSSTDKAVHAELREAMVLDSLLSLAKLRLKNIAEKLAEDAARTKKALIISDHGYDVYYSPPDKYYLGHGRESRLAKIAPLIIVEC